MIDMTKTIVIKSDQLNADDLVGIEGKTIKITEVIVRENSEQNTAIRYEGDNGKPWKPSQGMRVVMINVWGANGEDYVGRYLTLYREPSVKYAGIEVGGIRISHMSHIDEMKVIPISVSRGKKIPLQIYPLQLPQEKPRKEGGFPINDDDYRGWTTRMDEADSEDKIKAIGNEIAEVSDKYDHDSTQKLKAYFADRLTNIREVNNHG